VGARHAVPLLRGSQREASRAWQVITRVGVTLRQVWEQKAVEAGDEMGAMIALLEDLPLEGQVIRADVGLLRAPLVQEGVEKGGLHRLDQGTQQIIYRDQGN